MEIMPGTLRVLIHAPTANAVARAQNNALNLLKEVPQAEVRIIVNAEGIAAALDNPHTGTDHLTQVCANTLNRVQRAVAAPLQTVPAPISAIALMQRDGWCYIRA